MNKYMVGEWGFVELGSFNNQTQADAAAKQASKRPENDGRAICVYDETDEIFSLAFQGMLFEPVQDY